MEENKVEVVQNNQTNIIQIKDQGSVEKAIGDLIIKNESLLPNNIMIERIKSSAGFYIINSESLLSLDRKGKMQMLFGVLKEAIVGLEAGTDYDILPFKNKPVVIRNKNGWYKIIDMIKPAEIIKFVSNVATTDDEINFDPVKEEVTHKLNGKRHQDYKNIIGSYAYIKFANGFEKTVYMTKEDLDTIKKVSPSGDTAFSPWVTMPLKMVETKTIKELAKKLVTLYSLKLNSVLAQAIKNDEQSIVNIDENGNIISDKQIYDGTPNIVKEAKSYDILWQDKCCM